MVWLARSPSDKDLMSVKDQMTGDRYLVDGVVRSSSDLCVTALSWWVVKPVTIDRWFVLARLTLLAERRRRSKRNFSKKKRSIDVSSSPGWFCWQSGGVDREKIFRKKVEKFSKYFPSALEDTSFTIYREGHGTSEMAKNFLSPETGSYGFTRPLSVWQRPHECERPKDRWPVSRRWGCALE